MSGSASTKTRKRIHTSKRHNVPKIRGMRLELWDVKATFSLAAYISILRNDMCENEVNRRKINARSQALF